MATYYSAPSDEVMALSENEPICVAVGSDLIVSVQSVHSDVRREKVHRIYALDSDLNELSVLAECVYGSVHYVLPSAIETAVRLYPNHLFSPLD